MDAVAAKMVYDEKGKEVFANNEIIICEHCKQSEAKGFIVIGDNCECLNVCAECAEKLKICR